MPTPLVGQGPGPKLLRIGWENLLTLTTATVTTDSEAAGFEHALAYNGQSFNFWKPGSSGTHYLQCVLPVARPVSYLGLYAHTLGANGATVTLQYSTNAGGTWSTACTMMPSGTVPVYAFFPDITANYWRVSVASTPASLLGCVAFGKDMILPHGAWNGFVPPVFGRDTQVTNSTSETGTFLGRSIIKRGSMSSLDLSALSADAWMRANWKPFIEWAEKQPWFLLWNGADYPLEAAWCWTDGAIDKPAISVTSYMAAKLKFRCRLE